MPLVILLIANAAKVVVFNYIVGIFTIDVIDFGGVTVFLILLFITFVLVMIILLKQIMESRKTKKS